MSQCMFMKTFTQTCIHIFRLMFSNNKKCQKVKLNWRFLKKNIQTSNIFVIHFNLKKWKGYNSFHLLTRCNYGAGPKSVFNAETLMDLWVRVFLQINKLA